MKHVNTLFVLHSRAAATTCTPTALGMADATKIKDCQILGSYESLTPVLNGRKGGSGTNNVISQILVQHYVQITVFHS